MKSGELNRQYTKARDFRQALAVRHEWVAYVHVPHFCALLFVSVCWSLWWCAVCPHGRQEWGSASAVTFYRPCMVMGDTWEHTEHVRNARAGVDGGRPFMSETACKGTARTSTCSWRQKVRLHCSNARAGRADRQTSVSPSGSHREGSGCRVGAVGGIAKRVPAEKPRDLTSFRGS